MYKKLKSKTLYWGFPVCIISSLNDENTTNITPISSIYNVNNTVMIGLSTSSKAYANINKNQKAILNIVPDEMWSNIEKIASFSSKDNTIDKFSIGDFKLIESYPQLLKPLKDVLMYIEVEYINEIEKDGVAHICFDVKEIYANSNILDKNNYIIEDKCNVLLYQFKQYKSIGKKALGQSFRFKKPD